MTVRHGMVTAVAYSHALIPSEGDDLRRTRLVKLNAETTRSRTCAWPSCTVALDHDRVGILCRPHGDAVADAVLEDRVINRYFEVHGEALAMEQAKRDASAAQEAADRRQLQQARDGQWLRNQPGWVYYLLVGEQVKIGFTGDIRQRLRSYPPASELLAVEPGSRELEAQRHGEFRQHLAAGREWFRPHPELVQHMSDVVDLHGHPRRFAR